MFDTFDIEGSLQGFNRDLSAPFEEIRVDLMMLIRENFFTGGHDSWPPKVNDTQRRLMGKSGALLNSLRGESGETYAEAGVGAGLPYAGIQRFGGTTHPRITEQSRKFFWAMYEETGDEKWKGMALSKKDRFTVEIPAADYLELPEGTLERYAQMLGRSIVSAETTTIKGDQP